MAMSDNRDRPRQAWFGSFKAIRRFSALQVQRPQGEK
jgi:hypothetical protein